MTFKTPLPCLDSQWGLSNKDKGNKRLYPGFGLSTKVSLVILSACRWTNMNSALECQRVHPFLSACVCSEIVTYCAGLCVVINIEFNIIVLAAACWWAILRSPSWVMMKSHQLSRTRGRNWSDTHTHFHFVFHANGFNDVMLSVNFTEVSFCHSCDHKSRTLPLWYSLCYSGSRDEIKTLTKNKPHDLEPWKKKQKKVDTSYTC